MVRLRLELDYDIAEPGRDFILNIHARTLAAFDRSMRPLRRHGLRRSHVQGQ